MTDGVTGYELVIQNLNDQIAKINGNVSAGIYEASLKIEAASKKRTPVDVGNLRASAYTRKSADGKSVEVGYTSEYAASVHEMVGQKLKGQPRAHFGKTAEGVEFGGGSGKGNYWDSGEPKFLEKSVTENESAIVEIVRKRASVGE